MPLLFYYPLGCRDKPHMVSIKSIPACCKANHIICTIFCLFLHKICTNFTHNLHKIGRFYPQTRRRCEIRLNDTIRHIATVFDNCKGLI